MLLDRTGASSQAILQAHSTRLAQILPSYITPTRSLRSSSTTISAPLRTFVFGIRKCTNTLLQQRRIQKYCRGQYPRPSFFWGRLVCFRSSKMYWNTAMQNSRFRGEKSLFSFSENVPKLPYSNAEFKQIQAVELPESRRPGPPFLWRGVEGCLLLKSCLATPLSCNRTGRKRIPCRDNSWGKKNCVLIYRGVARHNFKRRQLYPPIPKNAGPGFYGSTPGFF